MVILLHFFVNYAPLIYSLLALGLTLAIYRLIQARAEARQAVYGLEREIAQRHNIRAVTALSLVFFLAIAEAVLSVFLAPGMPGSSLLFTPTNNPLAIPTSTLPPELQATFGAITPVATMTPQAVGCIPGQIDITSPKAGSVIRGQVLLKGSADIPNFGFFKYEFALLGTDIWTPIQAGNTPVQDGDLGPWDMTAITPGDYQLRLVVTNNQGDASPPCVVPLRVLAP